MPFFIGQVVRAYGWLIILGQQGIINQALAEGMVLRDAVIQACAVRAQPIVLTAVAAMGGAFFILDDPIFNGLAISLIFGIFVSTLLTLVVIPLLYFVLLQRQGKAGARA